MTDERLRVWTIPQPYATLILLGWKRFEVRAYGTAYSGDALVHAGKSCQSGTYGRYEVRGDNGEFILRGPRKWMYRLPRGAVVGAVTVGPSLPIVNRSRYGDHECLVNPGNGTLYHSSADPLTQARVYVDVTDQLPYGDFSVGRVATLVTNPQTLPSPIPFRGASGLRWVPDSLAADARAQFASIADPQPV